MSKALFDIKNVSGLSIDLAAKILKEQGYNELPSQRQQGFFQILWEVIKEPMLALLIATGIIYLLLGETKDALMLTTFIFVVVGITFYQRRKTERALAALKNLSSPRALVIRDGREYRIPGREVVRDDIVVLREGDRVPADGAILDLTNFSVDESLLTGESLPVRKSIWDNKQKITRPGGEDLPFVYSGTLVVAGRAVIKVISIGINTEMGKIGKALENIRDEDTLLQKETGKIVKNFAIAGLILCILVVIVYGLTRGNWTNGLLAGLTLSMAMLPEEFSVVLLIFLTLGAWRISKRQVLTRKTAAIETLGAATVLCVDKTGTLTLNRMELTSVYAHNRFFEINKTYTNTLPENFHELVEYGILSSQKDPFDPVEKEFKKTGDMFLKGTKHIHQNWELVKEYPLSKELLALSHVWVSKDKKNYIIAAKGAPEAIINLCHLPQKDTYEIMEKVREMAARGLRVLGVAKGEFTRKDLPKLQHTFDFNFIGLVGFVDPVRTAVHNSVSEAYSAGLRIIMVTGDYPGTACHVARKIGLRNPEKFITGKELLKMNHLELREKIKSINIFSRVIPEQKLAIVNALKANGEIVAMTGDGVNDAPALKSAHIGIAMGERGTDVAREASDLVLLNDDFSSIVQAVKLGRRIFDNLKKAMAFIFAVHIPIAGMSFLPIIFNMPLVLLPAHIAFLELIIDPSCSIVFEAIKSEKNIMKRPPRNLYMPLFDKRTLVFSLIQGLIVLGMVFTVYLLNLGSGELTARTLAFISLVFINLFLILTNVSWNENIFEIIKMKNTALVGILSGTLIALFLIVLNPFLRNLFHFGNINSEAVLEVFGFSILSLLIFEILKLINSRLIKINA